MSAKAVARFQDIRKGSREGHVQRKPDRRGPERPETEHRAAGRADPEKGCAAFGEFERNREADNITVERNGAPQIADGEVRLEQTTNRNRLGHRCNHGTARRQRDPQQSRSVFERSLTAMGNGADPSPCAGS
jgi:hypothetical protein